MVDVMKFRAGTAQRYRTPEGIEYLRIDGIGLRLTLVARPDEEPAPGAEMAYAVIAAKSPRTGPRPKPRTTPVTERRPDVVPRPTPDIAIKPIVPGSCNETITSKRWGPNPLLNAASTVDNEEPAHSSGKSAKAPSKKATIESRAYAALDRIGRLDPGGDDISGLWPKVEDAEMRAAIDLLHTPVGAGA